MARQKTAQTSRLAQRRAAGDEPAEATSMRLDKWLWCARFYKTRAIASEEIGKGRVSVNDSPAKPGRDVRVGDVLAIGQGDRQRTVRIQALSAMRGPATVAQTLYEETPESLAARAALAQRQKLAPEPAQTLRHGRPTKKDRRELEHMRQALDDRWTAVYKGE